MLSSKSGNRISKNSNSHHFCSDCTGNQDSAIITIMVMKEKCKLERKKIEVSLFTDELSIFVDDSKESTNKGRPIGSDG